MSPCLTRSTSESRVRFSMPKQLRAQIIIVIECVYGLVWFGLCFDIIFSMFTTVLTCDNCSALSFSLLAPQMDFSNPKESKNPKKGSEDELCLSSHSYEWHGLLRIPSNCYGFCTLNNIPRKAM